MEQGDRAWGRPAPALRGVASDLDGTLLRSDGSLSAATLGVLAELRRLGVPMVVATARTPRAVRKIEGHEQLGRVVCANGAIVWDAGADEVLAATCFEPASLTGALARLSTALPDVGVALLSAQAMFVDDAFLALRATPPVGAEVFADPGGVVGRHRISMVAVRHPGLTADRLVDRASAAFAGAGVASFASLEAVDIAPPGTTKARAVAAEMDAAGCPAASTVAFGDMPNDLALLAWSGWACAVANAHPSVLAAADEVVPTNDDDGVASTVRRLLEPMAVTGPGGRSGEHSLGPRSKSVAQ